MKLEKPITTSNGETSVGQILQLLISLGFINSLKSSYKRYRKSLTDEVLEENDNAYLKILRAYTINHYGGQYQTDPRKSDATVRTPKTLRQMVF